jgi:hypothetical protein
MFASGFTKIAVSRMWIVKTVGKHQDAFAAEANKLKRQMKATKDHRLQKKIKSQEADGSKRYKSFFARKEAILEKMKKHHKGPGFDLSGNWYKAKPKSKLPLVAGAGLGIAAAGYGIKKVLDQRKKNEKTASDMSMKVPKKETPEQKKIREQAEIASLGA